VVTSLPLPQRRCSSCLRTQSSSYQETTHCIATRGTSPIERETRSEASEPAALGAVAKTRVAWWNRPPFARGDDADLGVWVGVGGNHGRSDGEDYTRGLLLGGDDDDLGVEGGAITSTVGGDISRTGVNRGRRHGMNCGCLHLVLTGE
jgi:hypothetical protein